MQTAIEEAPLVQKTKELCQTILDLPKMKSAHQRMDAFMQNESARTQYNNLVAKGQALQEKQQQGLQLTKEEIAEFERERDALMNNPVARDFIDAQGELHEIKHSVHQYLNLTLELGRLPSEEELQGHSCGHSDGGCCDH
jgi:cell fate (sporulation/competence/biofilm development) regulator YlbF (YheA/YmcA/DUF963 family)